MPLFPADRQLPGLALLGAVLVTMGLDREFWNISWIVKSIPWLVLVSLGYWISLRRRA